MTFETLNNTIRTKLEDIVTTVPIAFENVKYTPTDGSSWVRLAVREGESSQVEIGISGSHRIPGVAIVSVFTGLETGDKEALELADSIVTGFRSTTEDGVRFRSPYVQRVGRDRSWYQLNVVIPFFVDS